MSSAFVVEDDVLLGIVTDRDLRVRFVATGLPSETPVREIMTPDIEWVDGSETIFATTLLMTQRRFHHLPVKIDGETKGIVTTSDLILAKQADLLRGFYKLVALLTGTALLLIAFLPGFATMYTSHWEETG